MKIPARFSIRSLLALTVLVALLMAALFEIRNHSRLDEKFPHVMTHYLVANWHRREAMDCRRQSSLYHRAVRLKANQSYYPGKLPVSVSSWAAEAAFHEDWADRFTEKAEVGREELAQMYAKLLIH